MGKSPLSPLCQRGVILGASLRAESLRPPFGKGRGGGILQMDVVLITRPFMGRSKNGERIFCAFNVDCG